MNFFKNWRLKTFRGKKKPVHRITAILTKDAGDNYTTYMGIINIEDGEKTLTLYLNHETRVKIINALTVKH